MPAARDVLRQMAQTVLPEYALTSLVLCVSVALGVALVGMAHGQRGDAVRLSRPPLL